MLEEFKKEITAIGIAIYKHFPKFLGGSSDFERGYFDVLVTEYQNLPPVPDALKSIYETAKGIVSSRSDSPTWKDIQTLEFAILQLQPITEVRRRLGNLREQYRKLAGQAAFEAYMKGAPDPVTASEPDVRADASQLLRQIHWTYTTTRACERLRRETAILLGFVTVLFGFVVYIIGSRYYTGMTNIPILPVILCVSVLGSFVSAQQRLQTVPEDGDPVLSILQLQDGSASIILAPISGVIFGLVLYLIFIGGLLQGALFPAINTPKDNSVTGLVFTVFSLNTGPATGIDFAKLLVWSFVAGFAERFVPDVLDRLISKSSEINKT